MARLEIHGQQGRTQRVELPDAGSLLIGSDAVCDVHLTDAEVQPIHARMKVQAGAFQVEATPEGKSVLHNGKRAAKCLMIPGDELALGGYRIYLFESQPAASAPPAAPRAKEPPRQAAQPPRSVEPPRPKRPVPVQEEPLELGWDDVAEDSEVVPQPPAKRVSARPEKETASSKRRSGTDLAGSEAKGQEKPTTTVGSRGVVVFAEEEEETRKLSKKPLILILSGTLVALGLTAFGLWWVIERTRANRAYEAAIANYESGDFATSSQRFQDFLRLRPRDARSSTARVLESLSRLREMSGNASPQLSAALTMASKELPALTQEPAWTDRGMEAAELVGGLARDLAARAQQTGASETIQSARAAYKLHEELAGEAAIKQRERLKVDNVMAAAEAAVAKTEAKSKALVEIDAALTSRKAAEAFRIRDVLLNRYPDLASDQAVTRRLDQGTQQVQENVKPLGLKREALTNEEPERLGPPITIFARTRASEATGKPEAREIDVVSGGGLTVGLDGRDGTVLWQRPTGTVAGFAPVEIPDDSPPSVLAYDDRTKSLTKLAMADGRLIWRQPLGDTPPQAPLALGNRLVVILPNLGQLLWVDLATGRIDDGLDMKWPLAGSATPLANDRVLYVPADQSVAFVISVDEKACQRSVYLGHAAGGMRVPPARAGRFLFFPENHEIRTGSIQTMLLDDRGQEPKKLQKVPLEGWSWFTPAQQGTLLWASHDRGGFSVFGIGEPTQANPLNLVARSPAINAPARPTVAIAVGQREALVVDRTAKQYRLEAQTGRMDILRSWPLPEGVPAAPITRIDDYRYIVHLSTDKDLGRIAVALDIRQEQPLWTTAWGMPMDAIGGTAETGKLRFVDPNGDGPEVPLNDSGNPVAVEWFRKVPDPGTQAEADDDSGELRWTWHDSPAGRLALSARDPKRIRRIAVPDGKLLELSLPLSTRIPPVQVGDALVVAGEGGEIALVKATDGTVLGQPFVPDFEKSTPWAWTSLVALEDGSVVLADKTGRLVRLAVEKDPPRLVQAARKSVEGAFSGTIVSTGRAILALKSDGTVLSLAARDLSTQTEWKFTGAGTRLFALDSASAVAFHPSGKIRVADASGQIGRETDFSGAMPAGSPRKVGNDLVWLSRGQGTDMIVWPASAPAPNRTPLGLWVQGPVIPTGSGWFVAERPGALRRIPEAILSGTGATPATSSGEGAKP